MDSDEYSIHIHTYVAVYSIKVYSVCVDILKYIIERDKNRAFVSSNQFKSKINEFVYYTIKNPVIKSSI